MHLEYYMQSILYDLSIDNALRLVIVIKTSSKEDILLHDLLVIQKLFAWKILHGCFFGTIVLYSTC